MLRDQNSIIEAKMKADLLLKNVDMSGNNCNIIIKDGMINHIGEKDADASEIINCDKQWVIPGLIDPHVHARDLELAYKENFRSAGAAAIRGGFTTIFDMPNTIPSTTDLKNLNLKRKAAKKAEVNCRFYLGATNDNNEDLKKILNDDPDDIIGIKIFLAASNTAELMDNVTEIRRVFELGREFEKMVTIHTELQKFIAPRYKYPLKIESHGMIRARKAAITGLEICLDLAKNIGNSITIAHVSTREEIEMIRSAKTVGEKVFCEVTPHHLLLTEAICSQMGNIAKVNPPLRTQADTEALWEAINNFTIDFIGSDHAPHTLREKRNAYSTAPSGFPGLDTSLRLMLTCVDQKKLTRERLVDLMTRKVAYLFNLNDYGKLTEGIPANITIIDPDQEGKILGRRNKSHAKYTPFEGFKYKGAPVYTIVNGIAHQIIR
jgi:dihydroorotase